LILRLADFFLRSLSLATDTLAAVPVTLIVVLLVALLVMAAVASSMICVFVLLLERLQLARLCNVYILLRVFLSTFFPSGDSTGASTGGS